MRIGYKHSPETILKMKKNHANFKGENNPFYGKNHSKKTRKVLSKKSKEWTDKHGLPWTGKVRTKSHRENLSIAFKKLNRVREKSPHWKGGKTNHNGYIRIYSPRHPFQQNSYVFEHRLVIEKQIKRYLKTEESVHHLDEIKDHNEIYNLMAFTSESAHQRFHNNPANVKPEEIIFDGRKLH